MLPTRRFALEHELWEEAMTDDDDRKKEKTALLGFLMQIVVGAAQFGAVGLIILAIALLYLWMGN